MSSQWLRLREPADAAARSLDLASRVVGMLDGAAPMVVHDLGCGSGSMGRWLAPLLAGPQHWVLHDRDRDLLGVAAADPPRAAADGAPVTVETRQDDLTRLGADDLAGASLVTASALLDMLTAEELGRFVRSCAAAACPTLLTLSVTGGARLTPTDPLDAVLAGAFDDHQRRTTGGRTLLGPDAAQAAVDAFGDLGARVEVGASPWRLGAGDAALVSEWLDGWVGAAVEQRPELAVDGAGLPRATPHRPRARPPRRHGAAPRPAGAAARGRRVSRLADQATQVVEPARAHAPVPADVVRLSVGLAALVALLALLATTVGLGVASWAVGLGCAAVLTTAVTVGLARTGHRLGPADLITLGRGLMACAVAALTVELLLGNQVTPVVLALTVPALVLDAVDGRVARRTDSVTAFGSRFDGEVDAFLILVLSVAAAPTVGWWVLVAGLARYAFAVAGWWLPWMRAPLEFRYWRKVVTATVGIVLTVGVADVLPAGLTTAVVVVGLGLLLESFGRDVWWLWRHRSSVPATTRSASAWRRGLAAIGTVLALALVWFALVAPTRPDRLTPGAFLRLPVEAVALAAVALVVSARSARAVTVVVGTLLGVVTLLKVLDLGTFTVLDRPFNVVTDRGELGSGFAFVRDSLGPWAAWGGAAAAVALVGAAVVCLPWAVGRLSALVSRHRARSARVVVAVAVVWGVCALSGFQVSSRWARRGRRRRARSWPARCGPRRRPTVTRRSFDNALTADVYRDPASADLSALAGKDVILAFVESYGRVAVEGPESEAVRTLLDSGTDRLTGLGYTAASGWLTSPTFGGSSWLAHSTLQSGLTIGDQGRYDQLLASPRTTLTSAFGRAGWRTVAVLPSTHGSWPEGQDFYRFDRVYDGSTLGYAGPRFGFSAMPDQFTLAALDRLELGGPAPHAGHGGGRAHLEPRAVGAAADDRRPDGPRRRVGLHRHRGGCRDGGAAVEQPGRRARRVPGLDRLLADQPALVRGAARGRRPRGRDARRPPAVDHRERLRRQPRRARDGDRARPAGGARGSRAGGGRPGCGRTTGRRCGRWPPSATVS